MTGTSHSTRGIASAPGMLAGLAGLALLWGGPAAAQTAPGAPAAPAPPVAAIIAPPASTATHYDLQPPVFGSGPSSVYDLNVSSAQTGPAGTVAVTSAAPSLAYSFDQYARSIHGSVSTGFSSNGGHEFSGMVNLPLVPGTADLDVGLATGQTGGYKSNGIRVESVGYDAYYAGLHLHPADNIDAYIGISGLRMNAPQVNGQQPYAPLP